MNRFRPARWFLPGLLLVAVAAAQQPALAGRVRTRAGEPAVGAELLLRWRTAPELPGLAGISLADHGLESRTAVADDRGEFKIALPDRGPFELTASLLGDRSTPRFPVLAGAFVELDLAAPTIVGGTVVDAAEQPVRGARVTLVPDASAWTRLGYYRMPEPRGVTVTDGDGRFALPFHDAYLRRRFWEPFTLLDFDVPDVACASYAMLRPTAHCRDLHLQLVPYAKAHPRAARMEGRSPPPPPPGKAADVQARLLRDGRALVDAPVLWSRLSTRAPSERPRTLPAPDETPARTDADGRVVLAAVAAETTLLGFVQVDGDWLPFARRHTTPAEGEAVGGVRLGDIDVGHAARPLRGLVRDPAGQPVADARILALPADPLLDEAPYVTYADHGGRYAFAALPTVPFRIWADCGTHGIALASLGAEATAQDLTPPAEGIVEGDTLDFGGAPLAGAWVVFVRNGDDPDAMPGLGLRTTCLCVHSDANGHVRVTGMPAGNWQVLANKIVDATYTGGGTDATTDGAPFRVTLRTLRE